MDDPHWVEYVGAIGGFVGVLLAGVAARFAWTSGKEAKRTADAAERTASAAEEESRVSRELAEIQRTQHEVFLQEQARAPRLLVDWVVHTEYQTGHAHRVILEIGWNNLGTKDVERAGFNLIVPDDLPIYRANSEGAVKALPGGWLLPAPEHALNEGVGSHYMTRTIDAPIRQATVIHVGFNIPGPGQYPLELKIFHHELPDGGIRSVKVLDARGGRSTLTKIEPGDLPIPRDT